MSVKPEYQINNPSVRSQIKISVLNQLIPNRFLLTTAAAKRARQLSEGAQPLIDASIDNDLPLDIALLEIQLGKIIVSLEDYEETILDEIHGYLNTNTTAFDDNNSLDSLPKKQLNT